MSKAAYDRGSRNIRRQIEDESKQRITVSRAYVAHLEHQSTLDTEVIQQQTEAIKSLNEQLKRAQEAYELRTAERNVANEELAKSQERVSYWRDLHSQINRKWMKCSAILNLIKLYVGHDQFEDWHNEAKHDHPELWEGN